MPTIPQPPVTDPGPLPEPNLSPYFRRLVNADAAARGLPEPFRLP
jgi:hypothetical protein